MEKRVAFITGGNRGIGLQTARELGAQGITVVLGVRDRQSGEEAVQTLRAEGIAAEVTTYDATKPETDASVFSYLDGRYGKLDILVNNAGRRVEPLLGTKSAATLEGDKLRSTFETNFFAVVRLTQALLPLLKRSKAGRIVNVSSILGSLSLHTIPDSPIAEAKPFAYNASKTALNAFTVHLADELRGTAIKVNSIHPGWVKTEIGGAEAPMEIAESARTSVRLATLGPEGPTGGFFHGEETLPW